MLAAHSPHGESCKSHCTDIETGRVEVFDISDLRFQIDADRVMQE
jgi:hypothetical protein